MMTAGERRRLGALWLAAAVGLGGCQQSDPAVVYGERFSLHIASVQVNDNTAEPLRFNLGFRRTIATVIPPLLDPEDIKKTPSNGLMGDVRAKGDAVSLFSSFDLDNGIRGLDLDDTLTIQTRFASGFAARNIADDPQAVKNLLGVTVLDTELVAKQRSWAIKCVRSLDAAKAAAVAKWLQLPANRADPDGVASALSGLPADRLQKLSRSLKDHCGSVS